MNTNVGFVPFPTANSTSDSNDEPAVLQLNCFGKRTVLDFGEVTAGKSAVSKFTIENPWSEEIDITTSRFVKNEHILLHGYSAEESKNRVYRVPPASCIDVNVVWTPGKELKSGGMSDSIELELDGKKYSIRLIGFVTEVKQKKKVVRRLRNKVEEKPKNLTPGEEENDCQRYKGVISHTAKQDRPAKESIQQGPVKKSSNRVLKCNQDSNTNHLNQLSSDKKMIAKENHSLKPFNIVERPTLKKPLPLSQAVLESANREEQRMPEPLFVTSPFAALDAPFSQILVFPANETEKLEEGDTEPAEPVVARIPLTPLALQEYGSGSKSEGGDDSTGTPRKRRTWGAPECNPLMLTPTVVTRGALKKIVEDSTIQQTFMECHSISTADSILDKASSAISRSFEEQCCPRPFTPPHEAPLSDGIVKLPQPDISPINLNLISPENIFRGSGGPLTATPLHPSMKLSMEKNDENLPCFNTSIIPHPSPVSRESEAYMLPTIETTSSTIDLSQEEAVASTLVKGSVKPLGKPVKASLKTGCPNSMLLTKPKKAEVHFQVPVIKPTAVRPKTAPGLARRDALKKNMTQEVLRPARHPLKRRSVSASKVQETPKTHSDINVRPSKRKDLVTPTMGPPIGKSPSKRPRPVQRVMLTDESFREKRSKSHDAPKTPANQGKRSRKSAVPPATGTRVKMQTCKSRLSALPRHPLALSTASNIYFDEKWKAKQERGFTVWLNFYLCPPLGSLAPDYHNNRDIAKNAARKARKSMAAPDSAKHLAKIQAERKLLQAERRACALFQSNEAALLKLEQEINDGGLSVRSDRKLDADLGLKDQLIDLLLCYNPVWLRLGLEVLYEEVLPLSEHRDLVGIVTFLNTRLVNNPVIAQKYAHPTVPGSYGPGYEQELRKFTVKKFLMLVLLLDTAKSARLLEYDPCLFCLKSPHKTSRSILISFSNAFLSGEGDITKHLNYMGYTVKHEQKVIEEVDYTVKHIETELRDGTRLTRVTEIITETRLTDKLRVPAVSRLQKLHNVGLVLTKLQEEGVVLDNVPGGPILSKSVVDGNQNLTLALIWRIIFQYSITRTLSAEQLKDENCILKDMLSRKKQAGPSAEYDEEEYVLGLPSRRISVDEQGFFKSEELSVLLDWCKVVCSYYDVHVDNFTVSFSDGRVLCLLVHHYHPELIPFSKIRMHTSLSHQLMELNASRDYLSDSLLNPEQHQENERENFRLLADAMKGLNEVPNMIFSQDMVGTIPDEKVVITFVAYLCAALLDISQDFRAAQKIQRTWRKYKFIQHYEAMREKRQAIIKVQALARVLFAKKKLEVLRQDREAIMAVKRDYAARKIQFNWRTLKEMTVIRQEFLKKREAVVKIQKFYKAILEERWQDRISAARCIQKTWRCHRDRRNYLAIKTSAIKIQSFYRMRQARLKFVLSKAAVAKISQVWGSYLAMKQTRSEFLRKVSAAVCIQRFVRGHIARNDIRKTKYAIKIQCLYRQYKAKKIAHELMSQRELIAQQIQCCIMIQSLIKGFIVRQDIYNMNNAASNIQCYFRSYLIMNICRKDFLYRKKQAIVLQSNIRGYLVRKEIANQSVAAATIQAVFRGYIVRSVLHKQQVCAMRIQSAFLGYKLMKTHRSQFQMKKGACTLIQSCFRGFLVRRDVANRTISAVKIQKLYRGYKVRLNLHKYHESARLIQSAFQGYMLMKAEMAQFEKKRNACIRVQSLWRMFLVLQDQAIQNSAATKLQTWWRMQCCHSTFLSLKVSAVKIQRSWRNYQSRRTVQQQKIALSRTVLVIQSRYRGSTLRAAIAKQHSRATLIQSVFRGYSARKQLSDLNEKAAFIQSCYRGHRETKACRSKFQSFRCSAIVIQSYMRARYARRKLAFAHAAATNIQRHYRGYCSRREISHRHACAAHVQAFYRGYKEMQMSRAHYLTLKSSSIVIQSFIRSYLVRRTISRANLAATKIQSQYRRYRAQKRYHKQRRAVMYIQQHVRAWIAGSKEREIYKKLQQSALLLQSLFRGSRVRRQLYRQHAAATKIQATWQMYVVRSKFLEQVHASVVIQSIWRTYRQQKLYMSQLRSATKIQAWYRMCRQRCLYKSMAESLRELQRIRNMILSQNSYSQVDEIIQKLAEITY